MSQTNKFTRSTDPYSGEALVLESIGSLRDELEYYIRAHGIFTSTPQQLDMYEKSLKNWCLAGKNYWEWMYDLIPSIREEGQRVRVQKHKEAFDKKRELKAKEKVENVFVHRLRKKKEVPKEPKIRQPRAQKAPKIKKEHIRDFEREYAFKLSNKKQITIEEAYIHIFKKKEEEAYNKIKKRNDKLQAKKRKIIEMTDGKVVMEFENQKAAIEWYAKQYSLPIASAKTAVFRSTKNNSLTTKGVLFKKKNE